MSKRVWVAALALAIPLASCGYPRFVTHTGPTEGVVDIPVGTPVVEGYPAVEDSAGAPDGGGYPQGSAPSTPFGNGTQVEPELSDPGIMRPPGTPTPDCLAGGVTLTLTKTDGRDVILVARGLEPGEKPLSIFGGTTYKNGSRRFDEYDIQIGADESGIYTERLTGLEAAPDGSSVVWDVRLRHSHGVVCATITMP